MVISRVALCSVLVELLTWWIIVIRSKMCPVAISSNNLLSGYTRFTQVFFLSESPQHANMQSLCMEIMVEQTNTKMINKKDFHVF